MDDLHRCHLLNLYKIAYADGNIAAAEKKLLYKLGTQKGLLKKQIDDIIANPHKAHFSKPSFDEAIEQLYDIAQMVLVDGEIHPNEVDLCRSIAKTYGLVDDLRNDVLVEKMIDEVKINGENKARIFESVTQFINHENPGHPKSKLSKLVVEKSCRILLPEFNSTEIKMPRLAKTLYILFLRHLNGIRLKELFQHKKELLEIYNKVTNKNERDKIENSIHDLVDMSKNSIHENCSRIRSAFVSQMDESIAGHYCIQGSRGDIRKVSLPAELIQLQFN